MDDSHREPLAIASISSASSWEYNTRWLTFAAAGELELYAVEQS